MTALTTNPTARTALLDSYTAYRSLAIPKPAYSTFATDHPLHVPWWNNRLRLLQLLGGTDIPTTYDVPALLTRIEPYAAELVPEMIVLLGRQGQHKAAIHLLTHGLGDFDTAVSYCVLGGARTYGAATTPAEKPDRQEQEALFATLLDEFLAIEDDTQRRRHTVELLGRFAPWFDVQRVLAVVPEEWSLESLTDYLTSALRKMLAEQNEAVITRALTSAANLNVNAELVEKLDGLRPRLEEGGQELS